MSIGNIVGYAHIVKEPKKTKNLWGPLSDIAGELLPVIEKNDYGDCMCYLKDKGLVDVDASDIRLYVQNPVSDPLKDVMSMLSRMMKV